MKKTELWIKDVIKKYPFLFTKKKNNKEYCLHESDLVGIVRLLRREVVRETLDFLVKKGKDVVSKEDYDIIINKIKEI
jgi:hypothetical protein